MKKILLFLLLFVNLQIVWQDGSLSFQLNSSTFAQSMGHEPGDEDSPSFDDDGIAWTTGYEGDDLIITPDDTPSDSDASTETTDSTDDSSSDEDGGGAGGYIGGINTIVVPEGNQKKDSCIVCHSIKGPNGECLCCPLCHVPRARCSCCKICGKPKDQCDCCEICHRRIDKCDCCIICRRLIENCDCCKICHNRPEHCDCCKRCNKLKEDCDCCKICLRRPDKCDCCKLCNKLRINCKCCKTEKKEFLRYANAVYDTINNLNPTTTACNQGVQAMFDTLFHYRSADLNGRANDICDKLKDACAWHKISHEDANSYANEGYFVIATWKDTATVNPVGHVNTILPGYSGTSWQSIHCMDTGSVGKVRSKDRTINYCFGTAKRESDEFAIYYYDNSSCDE